MTGSGTITLVAVHGAWADGSSWKDVILPLERQGLRVVAAPIPLTSLDDDAAALKRAIGRTEGPVILGGARLCRCCYRFGERRARESTSVYRGASSGRRRDGCPGLLSR